jgi:hypothetical protein
MHKILNRNSGISGPKSTGLIRPGIFFPVSGNGSSRSGVPGGVQLADQAASLTGVITLTVTAVTVTNAPHSELRPRLSPANFRRRDQEMHFA